MGLLTDPSAGQGKFIKALIKYYSKLSILLYVAGVVWFCMLAYSPLNIATYFSENALLPGLVKSEFKDTSSAKQFYRELLDELEKYDKSIPYPWLLAKFRQIGLDAYTHNFTLNYPLGSSRKTFTGKNVYGILRAARAASTEALVMSVPYRPPSNINPTTAPSIAIMLAFAQFANREKYWAKDIIFLITEHEQLGIQAWLEAYHSISCGQKGVLNHGDLHGRGGAIQAAVNLEFHDVNIGKMDVKVEGLNGQLPNLDLFNLATKMCTKEGIIHSFKGRINQHYKDPLQNWMYSFKTLMAMVSSQATGIPNGNHGLFHRFGIQALTMEGFAPKQGSSGANFLTVGRVLEGIFRSLNNLLERFHQSFFFYLLPSSTRLISIGLYMPAVCLIAGALFLKACGKWYHLQQNNSSSTPEKEKDKKTEEIAKEKEEISDTTPVEKTSANLVHIGYILLLAHIVGVFVVTSPYFITKIGADYGYTTETSIFAGFIIISFILLLSPIIVSIRSCYRSSSILNILALFELATTLICLSMYNFSLGFLIGVLSVPFALLININDCRLCSFVQKVLWLSVHPLVIVSAVIMVCTFISFPGETWIENILRTFSAIKQALVYSIVDYMIYSNWLYGVVNCVLLPNWLCFWITLFSKPKTIPLVSIEKKNA